MVLFISYIVLCWLIVPNFVDATVPQDVCVQGNGLLTFSFRADLGPINESVGICVVYQLCCYQLWLNDLLLNC